ncbi:diaminopimelate epimerase [Acuticoccus mangrovi]|uniref:Diaminopimelate epimerase n=1 Tax=Acuticoccus mangrovi TaxID=2796142 RepID=A0A934IJX2_9HYPH|nr:diaminopimelate epimerase [Acuticoccus mangrovi]MBJ3776356.1 diaminopimelate epimerase [Acuticoccus mangrovi]
MIAFRKMNGLGNDFVVVDARHHAVDISADTIRALGDRENGVGFDQFILIEPAAEPADATMRIFNPDGGEVGACGNAARCVAALLLDERAMPEVLIASAGGPMRGWREADGRIAIDMGEPRFAGPAIPLASEAGDSWCVRFPEPELASYGAAACVNVGNPHAVFFVPDVGVVPLTDIGPKFENHRFFPERANISFVTVHGPDRVEARVWERGAGATLACGTAACAIVSVGHRAGILGERVEVVLPGGPLAIALTAGRIVMVGPYMLDWTGAITRDGFVRDPLPTSV